MPVYVSKPFNQPTSFFSPSLTDKQDAECSTLKCSFNCKLTPQGPTCYCAPGQMPVNGTQCTDFDECTIEGICDHQCHNTPGSYECSCAPGYSKQKNRCYAINGKFRLCELLLFMFAFCCNARIQIVCSFEMGGKCGGRCIVALSHVYVKHLLQFLFLV